MNKIISLKEKQNTMTGIWKCGKYGRQTWKSGSKLHDKANCYIPCENIRVLFQQLGVSTVLPESYFDYGCYMQRQKFKVNFAAF